MNGQYGEGMPDEWPKPGKSPDFEQYVVLFLIGVQALLQPLLTA